MVNLLYTLSSYSMVIFFYIAGHFLKEYNSISTAEAMLSLALLLIVLLFIASIITTIIKKWGTRDKAQVSAIKPVENNLTPTYIGLFVIALSINELNIGASLTILLLLFVWWMLFERVSYFNPLWLILGWHFYEVTCSTGTIVFLVTRQKDYKQLNTLTNLRRINNYTFMEVK